MGIPFFEIFATGLAVIYAAVKSYGASIILLTIAVRLVLLPLSIKQTKSMREMQRIQPEVKRLQQRYKNDRQKVQAETMALYKEHGVNPFGGCGPLVLQFPVLIALYWVIKQPLHYMDHLTGWALRSDLREHALGVHRFLGLRLDCSAATARSAEASDAVAVPCGAGLVDSIPYLALIAVMGFTTYYQQKQMQATQSANNPQAQQMQMLMRIMPIFLMVIGYSFPAALVLYWTVTNVWTIVQQRIMLQGVPQLGAGREDDGATAKGGGKPKQGSSRPTTTKGPSKGRTPASDGRKAPAASSTPSRRRRRR